MTCPSAIFTSNIINLYHIRLNRTGVEATCKLIESNPRKIDKIKQNDFDLQLNDNDLAVAKRIADLFGEKIIGGSNLQTHGGDSYLKEKDMEQFGMVHNMNYGNDYDLTNPWTSMNNSVTDTGDLGKFLFY
uniref:Uncharacterized protein n=1 Tax=Meloidogyne hapla TaxID=6305 RepID=A0A1I8C0Z7_MELHA